MIRANFDIENLHEYICALQGIANVSITIFDYRLSPVAETENDSEYNAKAERIAKNFIAHDKTKTAIWLLSDATAEVVSPVFHNNILYAYILMSNLYFDANANPHQRLFRDERPVYDENSIRSLIAMIEFGVQHHAHDIWEVDPQLRMEIENYVENNIDKKITVVCLSKALHIETSKLRIFLLDEFGCNLPDYLRKKRIEYSEKLLSETDLPFAEIAQKVGLEEERWKRLLKINFPFLPKATDEITRK